jgi:hypothetical protein
VAGGRPAESTSGWPEPLKAMPAPPFAHLIWRGKYDFRTLPLPGYLPVPVSATAWGDNGALFVMLSVAVRVLFAVGLNFTENVQEPPAPTLGPQLFVCEKSPGLAPLIATAEMVRVPVPVFLRTTDCDAVAVPTVVDAKFSEVGVSVTAGAAATPVPETGTDWGEPVALSAMFTKAVRLPAAVGLNVTVMLQLPPTLTLVPHPLVREKSAGFAPDKVTEDTERGAVPLFVRLMAWETLTVATVWLANVSDIGLSATEGEPACTATGAEELLEKFESPA